MKKLIIMSIITSILGFNSSQSDVVKLLSPKEFKEKVENNNVQLVDVRTHREFLEEHIKGAMNIDILSIKFTEEFNKLDKTKAVFIYCRSGSRSRQASKRLEVLGFTEIYDLKGGILKY